MSHTERSRIKLTLTPLQIEIMEFMATRQGHSDFKQMFNKKLHRIAELKSKSSLQDCLCLKKQTFYTIPKHLLEQLEHVAEKHCTTIGHLSVQHIITPVLHSFFDEFGYF